MTFPALLAHSSPPLRLWRFAGVVFLVAQAFLSHTAKTLRDPNARRGIAWALAMQHAMLVCESRRVALLLMNK